MSKKQREKALRRKRRQKAREGKRVKTDSIGFPVERRVPGRDYLLVPPPMAEFEAAVVAEAILELASQMEESFADGVGRLDALLRQLPLEVALASLMYVALVRAQKGDVELLQQDAILEHHIELVVAMALRIPPSEFGQLNLRTGPWPVQWCGECAGLMREVSQAFFLRRSADASPEDDGAYQQAYAVEMMRVHTQAVRNIGYESQIRHMLSDVAERMSTHVLAATGCKPETLMNLLFGLGPAVEERLGMHRRVTGDVLRGARTVGDVADQFSTMLGDDDATAKARRTQFTESFDLETAKGYVLEHFVSIVHRALTFSLGDFEDIAKPGPDEDLERVVRAISLAPGSLQSTPVEHLFMGNPVWAKPLIALDDGWMVLFPKAYVSFPFEILEGLLSGHPRAMRAYEDARGDYLESRVEELLAGALPGATMVAGGKWSHGKKVFETDIVLSYHGLLLVVEAKGGRITPPAKRGGYLRIKSDVDKLVVQPTLQSERFVDKLESEGVVELTTPDGSIHRIERKNYHHVVRLNVNIDLFGAIGANSRTLKACGLIPSELVCVPTIPIHDLDTVLDVLETPVLRLHYLMRRELFEANASYQADEMDLLVFYCDTGFNIGEAEFDDRNPLVLSMLSKELDPVYVPGHPMAATARKPRRRLTRWWRDIVLTVQERRRGDWLRAAFVLLNVAYDDQVQLEAGFRRLRKHLKKKYSNPTRKDLLINHFGPAARREMVVISAYHPKVDDRREAARTASHLAFEAEPRADLVVVISMDVTEKAYPYSSMYSFQRRH